MVVFNFQPVKLFKPLGSAVVRGPCVRLNITRHNVNPTIFCNVRRFLTWRKFFQPPLHSQRKFSNVPLLFAFLLFNVPQQPIRALPVVLHIRHLLFRFHVAQLQKKIISYLLDFSYCIVLFILFYHISLPINCVLENAP